MSICRVHFLVCTVLTVACNFYFCNFKWLVCCLTGFYRPNWDGDDEGNRHNLQQRSSPFFTRPSFPCSCLHISKVGYLIQRVTCLTFYWIPKRSCLPMVNFYFLYTYYTVTACIQQVQEVHLLTFEDVCGCTRPLLSVWINSQSCLALLALPKIFASLSWGSVKSSWTLSTFLMTDLEK